MRKAVIEEWNSVINPVEDLRRRRAERVEKMKVSNQEEYTGRRDVMLTEQPKTGWDKFVSVFFLEDGRWD